jgi:midasin
LQAPPKPPGTNYEKFEHFWIELGTQEPAAMEQYILTDSIKKNLNTLARIVIAKKYPILLQGPTSSGKTSMVEYLAKKTGHRFVRINNHEHTDLQEYLGTYISDANGKLVFQEGILVEAVRKGYWIVLDELNLAPSEVLEALNRLLDDNRELFIPETGEVIKANPQFQLFATQNPPGLYGGRKVLSRAFRNRFIEIHVDDIPENELEIILEQRSKIPRSFALKLVAIMKDLQRNRQSTQVFAGKHGFITLRDLFRWAERKPGTNDELAVIGYMLLAERLRKEEEKAIIKQAIEKNLKVTLDVTAMYSQLDKNTEAISNNSKDFKIVWTNSMKRLFTLVGECIKHNVSFHFASSLKVCRNRYF